MSQAAILPETHIDEIPTRPSVFKAFVVSTATLLLFALGAAAWHWCPPALIAFLSNNTDVSDLFARNGTSEALRYCFHGFGIAGVVCAAAGLLSLVQIRLTYYVLKLALYVVYLSVAAYAVVSWVSAFSILDAAIEIGGEKQDRATILILWWKVVWPALAVGLYAAWLHVMLRSRSVYGAFTNQTGAPMGGDRVLEDVRTHGRDPRHRRSVYASVFTHVFILVIVPWIMGLGGCVEAYKVPKGSGNPVVAMVKVVQPKKKKKKTLSLRPNSAIIFETPDLDETEVDQEMEEKTKLTYEADPNAAVGKLGKGGGTKGGWPEGMENYKIRFIRLNHGGAGWDDGMNDSGADVNFLREFANITGFKKIARKGESHSISLLRKYPKDGFPPFVYFTGNGNIGRVSTADYKILREYCLNGGMLVADAGSAKFHTSFLHFIRRVFPDKPLIDIADDDVLYLQPTRFPDGAPAFWGHGGRRALGIKHEGRWVCYYHPGDMNDAWKSPAYTDVTPELRDAAMNLGVNIVAYSFNQWNDAVAKLRK